MSPTAANKRIIPKIEVHTISPAKHFNIYIKMKDIIMAPPRAAKTHFQFYIKDKLRSGDQ